MSGYTVTLTDAEYDALKARITAIAAQHDSIRDALRIVQRASIAHAGEQNAVIAALREQVRWLTLERDKAIQNRHLCERAMDCERLREALKPRVLAWKFHEAYERLAPYYGYTTRPDTRSWDETSPNVKLMIAVCTEISDAALASKGDG